MPRVSKVSSKPRSTASWAAAVLMLPVPPIKRIFTRRSTHRALDPPVRSLRSARCSLVHAARQETAVNREDVAADKTSALRCQKDGSADQFLGAAETAHRGTQLELLSTWRAIQQAGVQVGAEDAGRNRVDANAIPGPFHRQRLGEHRDRGLAGAVGRDLIQRDETRQ